MKLLDQLKEEYKKQELERAALPKDAPARKKQARLEGLIFILLGLGLLVVNGITWFNFGYIRVGIFGVMVFAFLAGVYLIVSGKSFRK
jgi:hypothetical protein